MDPTELKEKEKDPGPVDYLPKICNLLNLIDPKDAAVHACLTTAFLDTGEITVPRLDAFDPQIHVKVPNVQHGVKDRSNLQVYHREGRKKSPGRNKTAS